MIIIYEFVPARIPGLKEAMDRKLLKEAGSIPKLIWVEHPAKGRLYRIPVKAKKADNYIYAWR